MLLSCLNKETSTLKVVLLPRGGNKSEAGKMILDTQKGDRGKRVMVLHGECLCVLPLNIFNIMKRGSHLELF